ncbi:MAG: hypothetical protein KDA58_17105, partial [Planctomycetaceae bacterium]|nr:hypothetical protein [Planctomycetaceae bacterium]
IVVDRSAIRRCAWNAELASLAVNGMRRLPSTTAFDRGAIDDYFAGACLALLRNELDIDNE